MNLSVCYLDSIYLFWEFQSFLDNFAPDTWYMTVLRAFLLFQLLTVFPIIALIWRYQVVFLLNRSAAFADSNKFKWVLNAFMVALCAGFAIWIPNIGVVISWFGTVCGFGLIFLGPAVCMVAWMVRIKRIHWVRCVIALLVVAVGATNLAVKVAFAVINSNTKHKHVG